MTILKGKLELFSWFCIERAHIRAILGFQEKFVFYKQMFTKMCHFFHFAVCVWGVGVGGGAGQRFGVGAGGLARGLVWEGR